MTIFLLSLFFTYYFPTVYSSGEQTMACGPHAALKVYLCGP